MLWSTRPLLHRKYSNEQKLFVKSVGDKMNKLEAPLQALIETWKAVVYTVTMSR
jgi:hypothetical protein